MEISFNDLHKKQTSKLNPATFKKGFISKTYPDTAVVDIFLAENPQTILRNVPISSSIDITQVMAGDPCRVDLFDETNPTDMVVAYTYRRKYQNKSQKKVQFVSGTLALPNPTTFPYTFAHGLKDVDGNSVVPDIYSALGLVFGYTVGGVTYYDYAQATSADATNITLKSDMNPSNVVMTVYWWAVKFL